MSFLRLSYLREKITAGKQWFLDATQDYRKPKNLYYFVPFIAVVLTISLPDEYTNEYFYGGATGISSMALLYRHRWIAEFMHRKPTYIETATTLRPELAGTGRRLATNGWFIKSTIC